MTETLKLRTSFTTTVTAGEGTNSASFWARTLRSSIGVKPAAMMSSMSGSEIIPSGRTGRTRLIGSFFQTLIDSTSSGPIRYSSSPAGRGFVFGCVAACWADAVVAIRVVSTISAAMRVRRAVIATSRTHLGLLARGQSTPTDVAGPGYDISSTAGTASVEVDRERVLNTEEDPVLVDVPVALVIGLPVVRVGSDQADAPCDLIYRTDVHAENGVVTAVVSGHVAFHEVVAGRHPELQPSDERGHEQRGEDIVRIGDRVCAGAHGANVPEAQCAELEVGDDPCRRRRAQPQVAAALDQ